MPRGSTSLLSLCVPCGRIHGHSEAVIRVIDEEALCVKERANTVGSFPVRGMQGTKWKAIY